MIDKNKGSHRMKNANISTKRAPVRLISLVVGREIVLACVDE